MYIAHYDHSSNRDPHLLRKHVAGMLDLIGQFDLSFDQYGMTEASIVLHDSGKKSARFQKYVQDPDGKRGSVRHALGGAYALYHQPYEKVEELKLMTICLVSLIVASHHSGLDDYDANFLDKLSPERLPSELANIEELAADEVKRVLQLLDVDLFEEIRQTYDNHQFNLYLSILVRFTLSALVDADYLDTASYFANESDKPTYKSNFLNYQKSLQEKINELNKEAEDTILNKLRFNLQKEAFEQGSTNHSFFILRAPTGTGKTLTVLQFALEHARKFNKNRVITALPLINLTEEVSEIYRDIFGEENVTEDHSAVAVKNRSQTKYAVSERWATSFVVTTTVQLFESLFHNRPSKLRKLHHIYNSVIVIDEFHKLPLHVLQPIMQMLDMLQLKFKVTVILLSATPYPILKSRVFQKMNLHYLPKNIITDDQFFADLPQRVRYEYAGDQLELSNLVYLMNEKNDSVLTIVNTRKQAQQLFHLVENSNHDYDTVYHLSTTMCSHHRAKVISKMKEHRGNNEDKKIAVISTSILEAGVDVSFPFVFRMLAPLDSIIQAAGRCNRNHETELGEVTLFNLKEATYRDKEFESGVNFVRGMIKQKGLESITDEESIRYYRRKLSEVDVNALGIEERNYLCFRYLAKGFKMIEDGRMSVVCSKAKGFDQAWLTEKRTRSWWDKVKPFVVPIPHGLTEYVEEDGLAIWKGKYDAHVGIPI